MASAAGAEAPPWLPRYDVDVKLDVYRQCVQVKERVLWTNPHKTPTNKIVFNAHAHFSVADKDVGFLAKMLEILRLAPKEALDFDGPPLDVHSVRIPGDPSPLMFDYQKDNDTALEIVLPIAVEPGQSVTVELDFSLRLPQKQGRWGQWKGVTFLAQWLPVVAYFDDMGWQPAPFIPWHQPFFNEAGHYNVHVELPANQKLAASSAIQKISDPGNGWQQIDLAPTCVRDFALFCSAEFQEFTGQTDGTQVRVLALPGHEWYAQEMLKIACEAIPVYNQWFGAYPYPQFTVVESYFGWNGNECGNLVMIDQRVFNMPHMARNYVDALLTHEICHQWWYNLVGTNGYAETWMDEGLAVHFSNKVMDQKIAKNNNLITWPGGLGWLPSIHREDYRNFGMIGCMGRGEMTPVVQPMPEFGHLVNLMAMTYDRGSRIVGMIEQRLGHAAFLDFMRQVRCKYEYRILRVADYQHELEAYTGKSWEEFFQNWLYHTAMTDWAIESVLTTEVRNPKSDGKGMLSDAKHRITDCNPYHTTVVLRQKGDCNEPTSIGIRWNDGAGYQLRLPVVPGQEISMEDCSASVVPNPDGSVVVELVSPHRPKQIAVDPDNILLDSNPLNNTWKPDVNIRFTPLYTQLEETDITNSYNQWNVIAGPWFYGASYSDPWYTKSELGGVRVGVYRTQEFSGGAYLAYRGSDRNIVAGIDALWDHCPIPHMQVGFNFERSIASLDIGDPEASRGVLYSRYIFTYGDSLYLPPFHYVETFASIQSHNLPNPDMPEPGSDPFNEQSLLGVHYHINYLTPYWDPEGGFALDVTYQQGFPIFGEHQWSEQVFGQVSTVKPMPNCMDWLRNQPCLSWMMDTRWAMRLHGAAGLPDNGRLFPFGGSDLFRGYDIRQRQGSMNWIASLEWRVPVWQNMNLSMCDHVATGNTLYAAFFCDTGNSYINGHQLGSIAYAPGIGLRWDVSWFGLIERTMLRLDVARTVNDNSPWQIWVGIQHPF